MTRYFVFKAERGSKQKDKPGSPEYIACDITRTIECDGNSIDQFVAFPENTPEATFATLKSLPEFSMDLDAQLIDLWKTEAEPIRDQIYSLQDVIGNAYGDIIGAIQDLDSNCDNSKSFSDCSLTDSMEVDYAFEAMERPSEYAFTEKLEELFNVKNLRNP